MNKQRVDYAVNRLAGIVQQKVNAYRAQQPKYPEFTREEKMRLIRAGKATLRDDAYYRTDLIDAFDYPDPSAKKREAANRALEKFEARLKAEATRIKDQINLVDGVDAIAMLDEFAAKAHK